MSKTYRKNVRVGICGGTNTDFYKDRRRFVRHKNKSMLKELLSTHTLQDIADAIFTFRIPKKDTWEEPTDGCVVYNKDNINNPSKGWLSKEFRDKISRFLKPKHKT